MDNIIPVIVTGGGAPGTAGTIFALRNNPDGIKFKIITTDIYDDVVGKYLSDKFYTNCVPDDEKYVSTLKKIALNEEAKVILPQTTREIIVLAENKDVFFNSGIAVVISSPKSINIANDKYLLLEKAKDAGIPIPAYCLTNSEDSLIDAIKSLGYPAKKVVIKPRISNGLRGVRILTEEIWSVKKYLEMKPEGIEINMDSLLKILHNGDWPELLITEYLPGPEYTVDVFKGMNGSVIVPRLREQIRSGITFVAKVDLRLDLIEYSEKLTEVLDLQYCFGFQYKLSDDGTPKLLECNPRVQGTMVVSSFAGFNIIYSAIREALGFRVETTNARLRDGVQFKRYWGGTAVDNDNVIGRI